MVKAKDHDCKKYLVPYFKLKSLSIDTIKMKASCRKCHKTYTLIYLLEKIEGYDE